MARPSPQYFTDSSDGRTFFTPYDSLIARSGGRPIEVETGHGVTRVNSYGDAPGTPLVLLPGGGATSASYVNVDVTPAFVTVARRLSPSHVIVRSTTTG